jgi:hypothetical protein
MSIKTRLDKLEHHQAMRESEKDIPETLSPFEQYKRLINAPLRKADTTKPCRTYTPEEAYAAMTGKDHEHS